MTTPKSYPPSCVLYVDGARYNDGQVGENPLDPVALDNLQVTWGRNNSLDQPAPSTLTFTVMDTAGGQSFRSRLYIGARVDVIAEATIYPDPTVSTIPALLPGPVQPALIVSGSTSVQTIMSPSGIGHASGWVFYPPAAYSSDPSAWDALPRTLAGQSWQFKATIAFPATFAGWNDWRVEIGPVGYLSPAGPFEGSGWIELPDKATLEPGLTTVDLTFVPPAGYWLGFIVRFTSTGPAWDELDATTWAAEPTGQSWNALETVTLSGVQMLAPAEGALRTGSVVSGRITDLTAQYDDAKQATLVDVIAQSHLAELGNRYVGDTPWTVEPLGDRFAKIVAGSGQAIDYTIDPTVAGVPVTWRDVDRQPALVLLDELAKSVAGALWSATSLVTGPYLWLEDIDQRPSMYTLEEGADGIVRIILTPTATGPGVIEIDACDVLLEPVQWTQTTEDNSTRVVVMWQLQGVDDKGQPQITGTDETAVDLNREATTGSRRIQVTTQLSEQADAARVANAMLGRVVTPGWRISGLTIELAHEPLDARMLSNVMAILDGTTRLGLGILLTNLPAWSPVGAGPFPLFLEGSRLTNTAGAWKLELLTSAAEAQGAATVTWNELEPGWLWNEFDPAIAWNDLAGVGYP